MPKSHFCVVVPAYNEEKVITPSLIALKKVIDKRHIYVVSDGSTDNTAKLAKEQKVNVMDLLKNCGKASALDKLIKNRKLTKRYEYILFSDADSRLSEDFFKEIANYVHTNPACIVGTVVSDRYGLISAFRTYEYGLTHKLFKNAQNIMRVVAVAPGCASLYRNDVLEQLDFSKHTLTEDFDLTIQIHKKKLGQIVYVSKAKVITQDPATVKDYEKQIMRWYTGIWQNIFMHKLYIPNKLLNLEILLITLDGIAAIITISIGVFHPSEFIRGLELMISAFYVLSTLIIISEKKYWALVYVPLFPLLYFLNLAVYFLSFLRAVFVNSSKLSWQKVDRYIAPEAIRANL